MFGKENVSFLDIIFQKRALLLLFLIFIAGEILLHTQRGKLNGTYYESFLLLFSLVIGLHSVLSRMELNSFI